MGRCDSFVVETDVHFPTDINLLFDAVRKMIQIAAIISQGIGTSMWRQSAYNIKKFKRLYRIVQRLKHSTSKDEKKKAKKARQIMDAHKAYIELAEKYILKAKSTIEMMESSDIINAVRAQELQTYINFALWQIDLIKRRVLQDEKIPHRDKIFFNFRTSHGMDFKRQSRCYPRNWDCGYASWKTSMGLSCTTG
ncbi:hypothetical protein Dpo_4c03350 [Desulfotignum phosphitoxidans DSM 13687]|uniref:Uncharacterized protein n=1 Tax=Desulfotignum phosphitoxidans DSM 13687 TaxID=1286635 RepID=S0FXL2_9BACT|nr:hypothetical protein Dpo_4c03350 [Desulfotignum phosphitoxidans DSM 13687]